MNNEKLGNICELVNKSVTKYPGYKKYIDTGSVQDNKISNFVDVSYSDKPSRANLIIPDKCVAFARMKNTSKVFVSNKEIEKNCIISTGFAVLKPKKNISPYYLAHYLKTEKFNREKDKLCTGATQKAIRNNEILNIHIPFCSLEVQSDIVQIFDKIEMMRLKRIKTLEFIDELVDSKLHDLFGYSDKNNIKKNLVKISALVKNNRTDIKSGPFGSMLKKEFYVQGGYKIYGQEQVIKNDFTFGNYYINKERYELLKNYAIKENDILISLVGTYGKISIVPKVFEPGIINPRLMKISPDLDIINPIYLKYILSSKWFKHQLSVLSHGGTMNILNVNIVKEISIPVPNKIKQDFFSKILLKCELTKQRMQYCLNEIDNLYISFSNKYFDCDKI